MDDNASHSDTEQGSKISTQSTAHKVNGPAANAAQGVDSVGQRGTPTKPVLTRKTSSRGQTGSTSGQQAQHMAPVQSQPGQPLQLAQPETPDTHVRTLGSGRPPRHSPAVAPEVQQQQGSPQHRRMGFDQSQETQGPAGDSNQQQPPLGNPRLREPAVGSPQQTQIRQAQPADVTLGLQQAQARAPSQSGASADRHHASHAQQHSQDNNSVEAYYSAGSGVQPVISVMAPVTESNGSIEADLRGCTPNELK